MPEPDTHEQNDLNNSSFDFQAQPHWGPDNTYYPPGYDPINGVWIDPAYEQAYSQGYVWNAAVQNWVPINAADNTTEVAGESSHGSNAPQDSSFLKRLENETSNNTHSQSVYSDSSTHFWTAIPEELDSPSACEAKSGLSPTPVLKLDHALTATAQEAERVSGQNNSDICPPKTDLENAGAESDGQEVAKDWSGNDGKNAEMEINMDVEIEDGGAGLERTAPVPVTPLIPVKKQIKSDYYSVCGEHRVVVHFVNGQVKRGKLRDAKLDNETIFLELLPVQLIEQCPTQKLKAIFFLLPSGEKFSPVSGPKIRVTFSDERQITGCAPDYLSKNNGFFLYPADPRTNVAYIFIYRSAVKNITQG